MWTVFLAIVVLASSPAAAAEPQLRTGDVVVQTSRSSQSKAIQQATRSPYSHVGLVEVGRDGAMVIEAVGPVKRTPWAKWRARGAAGKALVLRPRLLDASTLERVASEARKELGKPYDLQFGWGDDALYCSELVYKAFQRGAGVEIGRLQKVGELATAGLEEQIRARYSGKVPVDLRLVTPAAIAEDADLELVWSAYAK